MDVTTIIQRPIVTFGREVGCDFAAATSREWLVTNGLGGYASGTVAGVLTRRYHGLLVAALNQPTGRTMLVAGALESANYAGVHYQLSTHAYQDGTIDPRGYLHIQDFRLEGTAPVWTFALGDALLERRIWMEHGANTTYMQFTLIRGSADVELEVRPLVTYRDAHWLTSGNGWRPELELSDRQIVVRAFVGAAPFRISSSAGALSGDGDWYWSFHHAQESSRGLDDRGDLFAAATLRTSLRPGESWSIEASTDLAASPANTNMALQRDRQRKGALLIAASVIDDPPARQQLTLAADQFIVGRRASELGEPSPAIIAGYHWFNDWGRDTMIALPGLLLATGRTAGAAAILRSYAGYIRDGLLPNSFPDKTDAEPEYNTADAALWYIWAVQQYLEVTDDRLLARDLLPALQSIVDAYTEGTRFGIGVDAADRLLRAGEAGWQVTWMDARVGDWVVTPRIGKPVELNALWFNALRALASLVKSTDASMAERYLAESERVARSFRDRFWSPERGMLADVVEGPDGDDWSIRPNQILAVSLTYPLITGREAEQVVRLVGRELLTSFGLRTLSVSNPAYRGTYAGDQARRDGAYHQGTVWAWLMGPYIEAHYRVFGDRAAALALLEPFAHHLLDAGLGTISEIFEADPPHAPRGCIAQAWSVGEVLRAWRMLDDHSA